MIGIHTDITERKQFLNEQKRLNRALRLLSECNLALVRNDDEIRLLNDVCRLIVGTGGYRMGLGRLCRRRPRTDGTADGPGRRRRRLPAPGPSFLGCTKRVRPRADRQGDPGAPGRNQPEHAYRQPPEPWRAAAIERGYQASIALPA